MYGSYSLADPSIMEVSWNGRIFSCINPDWCSRIHSGASVAASMTTYLVNSRPDYYPLYPSMSMQRYTTTELMEEYWTAMNPGKRGVLTLFPFRYALEQRAQEAEMEIPLRELDIPSVKLAKPSLGQCIGFIRAGIEADCPVAMLNLHSGKVPRLHHPRWIMITGITLNGEGPVECTYLDKTRERTLDFRLWYDTTWRGGGLVYVAKA